MSSVSRPLKNLRTRSILIRLNRAAYYPHPHWDQVDEGGEPLKRAWIGPIDEYSHALGCLPLAPSGALVCLSFILVGFLNIWITFNQPVSWTAFGDYTMAAIRIIFSFLGLCGCIFRWATGLSVMLVGYNIFLCTSTVSCIIRWMEWIVAMARGLWLPSPRDLEFMFLHFVMYVFIMLTPLWLVGIFYSLRMVISVGGTGWEGLNYLELRWKLQRQVKGADVTEVTIGRFAAAHAHPAHKIKAALYDSASLSGSHSAGHIDGTVLLGPESVNVAKSPLASRMLIGEVVPRLVSPSHKFDESISQPTRKTLLLTQKKSSLWEEEESI